MIDYRLFSGSTRFKILVMCKKTKTFRNHQDLRKCRESKEAVIDLPKQSTRKHVAALIISDRDEFFMNDNEK